MNSDTRKALRTMGIVTGSLAAGAGVVAGGALLYKKYADGKPEEPGVAHSIREAVLAPRSATQTDRERYASSPGEWTAIPASGLPAGARKVPIVGRAWTSLAPSRASNWPRERNGDRLKFWQDRRLFLDVVNEMRTALGAAGRGDEDVRCVLWLHALETLYGRYAWGYNFGNRKTRPYATAQSIREGFVWTTNPDASGVFLLVDRVRSFDSYPAFATLGDGLRAEGRFFATSRGNGRGYGGVLPGYRAGGLEGLKAARRAQHDGGYSPGSLESKLSACESWWRMGERILGADWRR